jgi:hypothetical protein
LWRIFLSIFFSPEPPPKVSGFLSEAFQLFAVLHDLERSGHAGHDLFEARVAAQIETCCLSGRLLNHGMFSERSLLPSDHSSGMPDGA